MTDEKLLSPGEVADQLGVKVSTVYYWQQQQTGPAFRRMGKHIRYRQADVDAWIDAQPKTTFIRTTT